MEKQTNETKVNAKSTNIKKVLSYALNTVIWLFVAFSLVVTILVFSAQGSKDGVPSLFGKSLITISTDSMEPNFYAGDLVLMQKLDDEGIYNLEPGEIITFHAPIDLNGDGVIGDINTHRIESISGNTFVTKGDHNLIADNEGDDPYTVHASDIIGKVRVEDRIPGVGGVISFLRSSLGFFLCIVLPLILFFLFELYNFINILVTEKAKRTAAQPAPNEEEIKRRAIEEYLAKQKDEEEIKRRAIEEYLASKKQNNNDENNSQGEDK